MVGSTDTVKKKRASREHTNNSSATINDNESYIEGSPAALLERTHFATNRSWMERKMRPRRRARGVNQQEDSYEEEKVESEHEKKTQTTIVLFNPELSPFQFPPVSIGIQTGGCHDHPIPSSTQSHPCKRLP
jgi:hypothetical protein